ncbi:MAG: tetratricopeptide repeat protein [Pseudomonadota bacterium]
MSFWARFCVCVSVFLSLGSSALGDVSEGVSLLESGDVSGAASMFAEAYEAGDGEGAFYLGRLFELGLGTEKDETRAADLYAAGAERGSVRAQLRLGLMYHEGRVLLRDYVAGTRLICAAAETGDAEAQLNCGLAYRAGRGVETDEARAVSYWEASAAQDHVGALNVLGRHHLERGDADTARGYLLEAAELGNGLALYEMARLLSSAETPEDVEAYMYASLSAVRGVREAGALLDRLEGRMRSEDVLAAQARARAWTEARIAAASEAGTE